MIEYIIEKSKLCCVVNCKRSSANSSFPFYTFPNPESNLDQREKWIAAVDRVNADGSPWCPGPIDYICGSHFLNCVISDCPNNVNYAPTIFPLRCPSRKIAKTMSSGRHDKSSDVTNRAELKYEVTYSNTQFPKEEINITRKENLRTMETRSMTSSTKKFLPSNTSQENQDKIRSSVSNSIMSQSDSGEECRACLKKLHKDIGHGLFEAWFTPWAVQGALIAYDLAKFADVEISESDDLPKIICSECYLRLTDACTFMIMVQMNDTILRAKFKNNSEAENVLWPKPILLNKSTNKDLDNGLEVEVKQEVLSEDENTAHAEQDWEPMMDIKIEPEEISAPAPTTVEENEALREKNEETTPVNGSSNIDCQEYLDSSIKQEPISGDELLEDAPDLPLDCMLCFKLFSTVSGLKAHVIADHSYRSVKRKTVGRSSPSPESQNIDKNFTCYTCYQNFKTRTDLMVHKASCGSSCEHVCYLCDYKFNTFRQLSRHVSRCRKLQTKAKKTKQDPARQPPRPLQVSQPVNDTETTKVTPLEQKPNPKEITQTTSPKRIFEPLREIPWKIEEIKEEMTIERVQEFLESWPSDDMEIDPVLTKSEELDSKVESTQNHRQLDAIKVKLIENNALIKPFENNVTEEIKEQPIQIETVYQNQGKLQQLGLELESNFSLTKEVIKPRSVQAKLENRVSTKENQIELEKVNSKPPPEEFVLEPTEKTKVDSKQYPIKKHTVTDTDSDSNSFISSAELISSVSFKNSSNQNELSPSKVVILNNIEKNLSLQSQDLSSSEISINICDNMEKSCINRNVELQNITSNKEKSVLYVAQKSDQDIFLNTDKDCDNASVAISNIYSIKKTR